MSCFSVAFVASLSEREEIVSTLMYLIKLVKSTVLNVLNYLKVEQYTTKEMKCKGDGQRRPVPYSST